MSKRPRRMRRAASAVLICILFSLGAQAAAAAQDPARVDLYELFEIDQAGSDVILVVDTSLSMKQDFATVRSALNGFGSALQPQDKLTVITFDDRAKKVYQGPAGAKKEIDKALPDQPRPGGDKTNLGEAVELAIEEAGSSKKGPMPVIVFLTDGREDPPAGSQFAVRHNEAWSELADKAASGSRTKLAFVHGIGLNQNTDIERLKQVWPSAKEISINPDELRGYFQGLKEKISRARLQRELRDELKRGQVRIEVEDDNWGTIKPGTSFEQKVTIRSEYERLPVEVDLSGVDWLDFKSTGGEQAPGAQPEIDIGPVKRLIRPGETARFVVRVTMPKADSRFKLQENTAFRGKLGFKVAGASPAADKISALDVDPRIKIEGAKEDIWFTRRIGTSVYLFAVFGLMALVLLGGFGRYAMAPVGQSMYRRVAAPALFGRLAFSAAPQGTALPRPISLEGRGRRVTLGSAGAINLSGPGIEAIHAEIETVWDGSEPRAVIKSRDGRVKVGKSAGSTPVLVTEPATLARGSIIQIGDYKIQWS